MAIANRATSLIVDIHHSKQATTHSWEPVRIGVAMLKRFWWHNKAYATVLMIGLLTLLSLIFLRIHWTSRKLLFVFTQRGVGGYKWHTFSRKSTD